MMTRRVHCAHHGARIFAGALILAGATPASAQDIVESFCDHLLGARLVAQDGTFLGTVGSEYDPDSIFNEHSLYGSEYGPDSIHNEYSIHGSAHSDYSPYNEYAARPPWLILVTGQEVYVTTNEGFVEAMSPYSLLECGE